MRKFVRTRGAGVGPEPVAAAAAGAPGAVGPAGEPKPATNGYHHKLNGHANGGVTSPVRPPDDHHSTLSSRYWSRSSGGEPPAAAGAAGAAGAGVVPAGPALWTDAEFPAGWQALGNCKYDCRDVVWLRPHELVSRPTCGGGGGGGERAAAVSAAGRPGSRDLPRAADSDLDDEDPLAIDRWVCGGGSAAAAELRAAAAALQAAAPRLLARVLGAAQPLRGPHYTGEVRFRLWSWSGWRTVRVDDRLPARRGRLLGARPLAAPADFTLPLLEKAYAKVHGSYMAARAQSLSVALSELSGGVVQRVSPPAAAAAALLHAALPRSTLVLSLPPARGPAWQPGKTGAVAGQPYLATGLARVRAEAAGGEASLVRVRGASGRGGPWRGAWAPGAPRWHRLLPRDQDLLAARVTRPAEFWMSVEEWASVGGVWLVHVGPDDWVSEPALRARRPWRAVLARRRWTPLYNAGGPPHCKDTFASNPQFHVQIPECGAAGEGARTLVALSVLRAPARPVGAAPGGAGLGAGRRARAADAVGFALYVAPPHADASRPLQIKHLACVERVMSGGEASCLVALPAGQYRVVAHGAAAGARGSFLLRVLTDAPAHVWELNNDNVLARTVAADLLLEPQLLPQSETHRMLLKMFGNRDYDEVSVDAEQLLTLLGGRGLCGRRRGFSRALCRALVALRRAGARRARAGTRRGRVARRAQPLGRARAVVGAARGAGRGGRGAEQQGGGGGGAALGARGRAVAGARPRRARASAPRTRAASVSREQVEKQSTLVGRGNTDDNIVRLCRGFDPGRAPPTPACRRCRDLPLPKRNHSKRPTNK